MNRRTPHLLQQQPSRSVDRQQQQMSGGDFQNRKPQSRPQQMGEGSYEGTADYNERTDEYLRKGTVEQDAEAARPRSEAEKREMEKAEKEGLSHSKAPGE
jgi:hypothetical protein